MEDVPTKKIEDDADLTSPAQKSNMHLVCRNSLFNIISVVQLPGVTDVITKSFEQFLLCRSSTLTPPPSILVSSLRYQGARLHLLLFAGNPCIRLLLLVS